MFVPMGKTEGALLVILAIPEASVAIGAPRMTFVALQDPRLALAITFVGHVRDGGVLSTVNVALGPAAGAVLPAVSDAVPAAMEIPMVPSPVVFVIVTVRVVPEPETNTVPFAVPVLFKVTVAGASVLALKCASA